jgi:Tol biopolymer transport system component
MYDIFLVHPDSAAITRLTQEEGHRNESPAHSPDGQQIAFTSNRPPGQGKKLYVMDVDGKNPTRVSKAPGDYENPAWGPRRGWD